MSAAKGTFFNRSKKRPDSNIRSPLISPGEDSEVTSKQPSQRDQFDGESEGSVALVDLRTGSDDDSGTTVTTVDTCKPGHAFNDGYKYDMYLFLPNPNDPGLGGAEPVAVSLSAEEILEKIHILGLSSYAFLAFDQEQIIVKVGVHLDRLKEIAEEEEMIIRFDEKMLKEHADDPRNPIADNRGKLRLNG